MVLWIFLPSSSILWGFNSYIFCLILKVWSLVPFESFSGSMLNHSTYLIYFFFSDQLGFQFALYSIIIQPLLIYLQFCEQFFCVELQHLKFMLESTYFSCWTIFHVTILHEFSLFYCVSQMWHLKTGGNMIEWMTAYHTGQVQLL